MSVNKPEEVALYLEALLGKDAVAKLNKQLEVSAPAISKFSNRKGYEKALKEAGKALEEMRNEVVFSCPSATGQNVNSAQWHDLRQPMSNWGPRFASNAAETIAYVLSDGTRRRRQVISEDVYKQINDQAEALDAEAAKIAKHLLNILRPLLILEAETNYKNDSERFLRHLARAKDDLMDEYLPFLSPVQKTINSVDKGNAAFSAAVKYLSGKTYEEVAKVITGYSIHGSRESIKLPVESIAIDSIDPYFGFIAMHDSLIFYIQTRTSVDRQDKDGRDDGITNTDVTDKVKAILNILLK